MSKNKKKSNNDKKKSNNNKKKLNNNKIRKAVLPCTTHCAACYDYTFCVPVAATDGEMFLICFRCM